MCFLQGVFLMYVFICNNYFCRVDSPESRMKNITDLKMETVDTEREIKKTVSNVMKKRQSQENSSGLHPASSKSEKPFK